MTDILKILNISIKYYSTFFILKYFSHYITSIYLKPNDFFRNKNYFSSENSIVNLFHYGSKINGKDSQTEFLLFTLKSFEILLF